MEEISKEEMRQTDRQIRRYDYPKKMIAELKEEAKYVDQDSGRYRALRSIAKGILQSRNQYMSLVNAKAKLNSVVLELKEHSASPAVKVRLDMDKQRKLVHGWIREAVMEFPTDLIAMCLQYYLNEMHAKPCLELTNLLHELQKIPALQAFVQRLYREMVCERIVCEPLYDFIDETYSDEDIDTKIDEVTYICVIDNCLIITDCLLLMYR